MVKKFALTTTMASDDSNALKSLDPTKGQTVYTHKHMVRKVSHKRSTLPEARAKRLGGLRDECPATGDAPDAGSTGATRRNEFGKARYLLERAIGGKHNAGEP